jgi:hypothetical protein
MSTLNQTNSSLYQRLLNAPEDTLRDVIPDLIDAHLFEELHELIVSDFMWAKRIRFESHRNFVQDIERIIEVVRNEGFAGLPRLIFYSMLYATFAVYGNECYS